MIKIVIILVHFIVNSLQSQNFYQNQNEDMKTKYLNKSHQRIQRQQSDTLPKVKNKELKPQKRNSY